MDIEKKKLKISLIKFCGYIIFTFIISYLSQKDFIIYYKEYFATIFTLIGGRFLFAELFSNPINSVRKSIEPFLPDYFNMSPFYEILACDEFMNEPLFNYDNVFLNSIKYQLKISLDIMKEEKTEFYRSLGDNDWGSIEHKRRYNKYLTNFKLLRNIALIEEDKNKDKNKYNLKNIYDDLNNLLSSYDDDINLKTKDIIRTFLYNIINTESVKLNSLFLYGKPGVGKTRLINKIVDILNKEMKINLYKPTKDDFYNNNKENLEKINIVLNAYLDIKKGKCDGAIIFIDEFDKSVFNKNNQVDNDIIKFISTNLLLDENYCMDYQFKIKIPLNKILIVFAGNELPWDLTDRFTCMKSRIDLLEFPNLTLDLKKKGLIQLFSEKYSDSIMSNDKLIEQIDKLLKFDDGKTDGLRELSTLLSVMVDSFVKDKYFDDIFKVDIDIILSNKFKDINKDKKIKKTKKFNNYDNCYESDQDQDN